MATAGFALGAYDQGAAQVGLGAQQQGAYGAATCSNIWPTWNQQYAVTTGYCVSTNYIWVQWNQACSNGGIVGSQATTNQMMQEQIEEWNRRTQEQAAEQQRRAAEQARVQAEADAKAEVLLKSVLADEQRKQYERDRAFEVLVCKSGKTKRYRLKHGWAGNAFLLDENGVEVEKYCIHPAITVPIADNLVAQKLLLEADEDTFLRIANKTVLRGAA